MNDHNYMEKNHTKSFLTTDFYIWQFIRFLGLSLNKTWNNVKITIVALNNLTLVDVKAEIRNLG